MGGRRPGRPDPFLEYLHRSLSRPKASLQTPVGLLLRKAPHAKGRPQPAIFRRIQARATGRRIAAFEIAECCNGGGVHVHQHRSGKQVSSFVR